MYKLNIGIKISKFKLVMDLLNFQNSFVASSFGELQGCGRHYRLAFL